MPDATSRYLDLPMLTHLLPNGTLVPYLARRFCPQGALLPQLTEVEVREGDRLDLLAARTLGSALQAWHIADANDAMDPAELTARAGRRLRVPVPQA